MLASVAVKVCGISNHKVCLLRLSGPHFELGLASKPNGSKGLSSTRELLLCLEIQANVSRNLDFIFGDELGVWEGAS